MQNGTDEKNNPYSDIEVFYYFTNCLRDYQSTLPAHNVEMKT